MDMPKTVTSSLELSDGTASLVTGSDPEANCAEPRARVALVDGRTTGSMTELEQLLKRRLELIGIIVSLAYLAYFIDIVVGTWSALTSDPITWLRHYYPVAVAGSYVVCISGIIVDLRRRQFASLRYLRWIEAVAMILSSAFAVTATIQICSRVIPGIIPLGNIFPMSILLLWTTSIVMYGILIPNTARRCLLVIGMIVAAAIVSMYGSWLYYGVPRDRLIGWTIVVASNLCIAVAVTVAGAHWTDQLRRQVHATRRIGQYSLRERLGSGGMGEVYFAEHQLLRRPAAIKLVRPDRAGDTKALRRFEREVQATATLTHPNTIQLFDYGHAEDGTFYYVMEYLSGLTLQQLICEHGPLPACRARHFLRQVCGALSEAHAIGLIHRDIKPGNVMICKRGGVHDVVKLLDFGLVLPISDGKQDEKLTHDGAITGTPHFMSPEQSAGQELLDARSDIYSVGALAYFLLTGKPPFADRSLVKTLAAHIYESPDPISRYRSDVPADLETVVLRCLAKNPVDRYISADELDSALGNCSLTDQWTSQVASDWWATQRVAKSSIDGAANIR